MAGNELRCGDEIDEAIVAHIQQGLTNREIGKQIFISEHTVAHRITRTLRRSGLRNRVQIGAANTDAPASVVTRGGGVGGRAIPAGTSGSSHPGGSVVLEIPTTVAGP